LAGKHICLDPVLLSTGVGHEILVGGSLQRVVLGDGGAAQLTEAAAIGRPLELAVGFDTLGALGSGTLDAVLERCATMVIERVIALPVNGPVTPGGGVAALRRRLKRRRDVPVGGGSDAFFAELNDVRPDPAGWDFVSFQV
jgi:hypothetical protein